MNNQKLLDAFEEIGDPPCTGCSKEKHCATNLLACSDYHRWVNTGSIVPQRKPSPSIYNRLHCPDVSSRQSPVAYMRQMRTYPDGLVARIWKHLFATEMEILHRTKKEQRAIDADWDSLQRTDPELVGQFKRLLARSNNTVSEG